MASKEPSLSDLARALGISQLAAQRHAKAAGGAGAFSRRIMSAMNHILGGGSRRRLPGALPKDVIDALGRLGQGGGPPPTVAPEVPPPFSSRPKASPKTVGSRTNQPPTAEEESEWTDEFRTPTSSNVYSFQAHRQAGATTCTLLVTFKAAVFKPGAFETGEVTHKGSRSRSQLNSSGGVHATGWARPDSPGARYQYLRVPFKLFNEMKDSYSKGKFVWDRLRVRGTIGNHQYQYNLVSGQVLPGAGGAYIPRKATPNGFRTRSLADAGLTGRRGFVTSTLPASSSGGFSTRRPPGK